MSKNEKEIPPVTSEELVAIYDVLTGVLRSLKDLYTSNKNCIVEIEQKLTQNDLQIQERTKLVEQLTRIRIYQEEIKELHTNTRQKCDKMWDYK